MFSAMILCTGISGVSAMKTSGTGNKFPEDTPGPGLLTTQEELFRQAKDATSSASRPSANGGNSEHKSQIPEEKSQDPTSSWKNFGDVLSEDKMAGIGKFCDSLGKDMARTAAILDPNATASRPRGIFRKDKTLMSRVQDFWKDTKNMAKKHKKKLAGSVLAGAGLTGAYAMGAFGPKPVEKTSVGSKVGTVVGTLATIGGIAYGAKKYMDHKKLGRESGETKKSSQAEKRAGTSTYEVSEESGCKMYPKSIIIGGIIGILSALVFVFYCLCSSKESGRRATVDLEMGLGDQ